MKDPAADAALRDRILILDFGSQVTQLIARRLREAGVYCEIFPFAASPERIAAFDPRGIILSGGPASVLEAGSPRAAPSVYTMGVPVLGICYGQQAMVTQLGGQVARSDFREFGRAYVEIGADCALFAEAGEAMAAWRARACVDEPWRSRGCPAARLCGDGQQRGRALRRDRR